MSAKCRDRTNTPQHARSEDRYQSQAPPQAPVVQNLRILQKQLTPCHINGPEGHERKSL
jgi:hypothetical protein